jgi:uncharacterized protein
MHTDKVLQVKLAPLVAQQPYPLLFATVSGAHLYGFPSPDSDYDLRGVHILPLRELVGLYAPQETIEIEAATEGFELDLVTHDVGKFIRLMLKRNGYVLEQLLSPLIIHTTPHHEELKSIVPSCITHHHAHHYLGFAQTQWELFNKETPRRVKPLLYVYRVLLTGIHLMQTGEVEANLVHLNEKFKLAYLPELIARKTGGAEKGTLDSEDVAFHEREYQRLVQALHYARDATTLPDTPSAMDGLNDLLLRIRGL